MLLFEDTPIAGVKIFRPKTFNDNRGFFSETYSQAAFAAAGLDLNFVQDNESESQFAGTIRGLHFQSPPYAQTKLVRVTQGAIMDVAVDLRRSSPTYGRHVAVNLTEHNHWQLLIPEGFAHGFCTLRDATRVAYKVTAPYAPKNDHGLLWSDEALNIDWPIALNNVALSDKDKLHPRLAELAAFF